MNPAFYLNVIDERIPVRRLGNETHALCRAIITAEVALFDGITLASTADLIL